MPLYLLEWMECIPFSVVCHFKSLSYGLLDGQKTTCGGRHPGF